VRRHSLLALGAVALVSLFTWAASAQAQQIPRLPFDGLPVQDMAAMLTSSEERTLARKLSDYRDTTSTEIVVATVPALDGIPIEQYAVELGRQWGIGQQDKDNGLLILVAREERRVFIATGYGLEGAIPDVLAARVIRNIITPAFRQGQFYGGLSEATDVLIAAAEGEFQADDLPRESQGLPIDPEVVFLVLIILFFVMSNLRSGGGKGGQRYRRHGGGPPVIIWGGGGFGGSSGGGFGGGGFGGFGGGGSFGGGGAGGGW